MELRLRQCAEDQYRHSELEDEFGKRNTRLRLEIAGGDDEPSDEDHQEDGKDILRNIEHGIVIISRDAIASPAERHLRRGGKYLRIDAVNGNFASAKGLTQFHGN